MANVISVPVPNGTGGLAWSGRQTAGINSIAFYNTDLVNTVWLGTQTNITPNGPGAFPVLPNGQFSGDPTENWYVTGETAGIVPLVVIPNGLSFQQLLTAGLGNLVLPSVQSPNFSISGKTGWSIMKNGDAYFFNIVAQGTITATEFIGTDFVISDLGAFFYTGTPTLGNLRMSITTAAGSNDGVGNAYQENITIYNGTAYLQLHVNGTFGAPAIEMITGVGSESDHAAVYTAPNNVGLVNEVIGSWFIGAGSSFDGIQAAINLASSAKDGSELVNGTVGTIKSGTFTGTAFWDVTGFQSISPGGGNGWYVNGTQTDAGTNTVGDTGTAGAITKAYTIPANDSNVATIYEIECPYTATLESEILNIGAMINGSFVNIAPIGGALYGAGTSVVGTVRLKLTCTATGSSGKFNLDTDGSIINSGVSRLATGTFIDGHVGAHAISTLSSFTVAIGAQWGGTATGLTISGITSKCTRIGQ